jgi:hypothetical protein
MRSCLEPGCEKTFANDKNLGRHCLKYHGNIIKDYDHSIPKSGTIRQREFRARKNAEDLAISSKAAVVLG